MTTLRSRKNRRVLVVAVLAVCGFLLSPFPSSLHGAGLVPTLVLGALDVALIRATGVLAFARRRSLDERQVALRDLAYRRGFRLLGLGLIITFAGAAVGGFPASSTRTHVDSGISARFLIAILELLVIMPTLVIAWSEPDGAGDDSRDEAQSRAPALVIPAIVVAWLMVVSWVPPQTAAPSRTYGVSIQLAGATCRHFATGHVIGAEFGATVGMRVSVCWNGREAFVLADPSFPPPPGVEAGPDTDPSLTACAADNVEDFAIVSDMTCTGRIDSAGTLHYSVNARVSPLPMSIGARDVRMNLVVTRDGRILEHP